MFTPSTPARAMLKRVSSTHSAEANVSLTPRAPPQETLLSSSARNGMPRAWAVAIAAAMLVAGPAAAAGARRLEMVGNSDESRAVKHRCRG